MTTVRDRLWMNFEEIVSDAAERIMDIAHRNVQRPTLRHWASQANQQFARRSEVVKGTQLRALVAGQSTYRLPVDCIRPNDVYVTIPGMSGERLVDWEDEQEWADGTAPPTGEPYWVQLTRDRRSLVFRDTPSKGGFEGYAGATAGDDSHIVGPTDMSDQDDFYNGLVVRVLSGNQQAKERTIVDYAGSTRTLEVDATFSSPVALDDRFVIHPDSVRIEYARAGNAYIVKPVDHAIHSSPTMNTHSILDTTLPQNGEGYWDGLELRMTSGAAVGYRGRIVSSSWALTRFRITLEPELPVLAAADDTFRLTDVPNIPGPYHDALVAYCVYRALSRWKDPAAKDELATFLESIDEAKERDEPADGEFYQIKEYGHGEEEWE